MNMRYFLLIAAFLLTALQLQAQKAPAYDLEVDTEYREDGSYDIVADVYGQGTFTVIVRFDTFKNLRARGAEYLRSGVNSTVGDEYAKSVMGKGRVLTLTPISAENDIDFRYTYSYARGRYAPNDVEHDFVYRLPYGAGKSRKALDMYDVGVKFGEEQAESFKVIEFNMSQGDTVYTARKGVVVEVIDGNDIMESQGEVQLRASNNEITVEHADGTLANYEVLQKGSIMVKPGDTVYPDTPLALAGSYDGKEYQLQFQIIYLVLNTDTPSAQRISDRFDYAYVNPLFETAEGNTKLETDKTYTATINDALITREMTKRETNQRAKKR